MCEHYWVSAWLSDDLLGYRCTKCGEETVEKEEERVTLQPVELPELAFDIREHIHTSLKIRAQYLELLAGAYLHITSLPPDQVILVEQYNGKKKRMEWWLEKKGAQRPSTS